MRLVLACAASLVLGGALIVAQSANYSGYAFPDCGPTDGPAARLILVQGAVPAGIPDRAPRPSIDILINTNIDGALAGPITIAAQPSGAMSATAQSCPVVGRCAAADSGTLSLKRDGGTLTGEFNATWGTTPARQGKFTVEWRDRTTTCP
jgi:hypothetical protein